LYNRRNEFLLKSWQAPPNNKRDSVTTLTKLMRESVTANDSLSTRRIVEILNSIPGLPPEVLASETDAFVKFGSVEEQRAFAEMLADGFPSSPTALGAAGVLFMNLGELERCGAVLARSYELDSTNFRVALNYGVYLANRQDFYAATPVLRQALKLDGASFFAAYYLANSCLAVGDVAGAKEAMLHAEANALRPEEQERIKQLKMRF
jgi:Flp pilus assembly protein TadD